MERKLKLIDIQNISVFDATKYEFFDKLGEGN